MLLQHMWYSSILIYPLPNYVWHSLTTNQQNHRLHTTLRELKEKIWNLGFFLIVVGVVFCLFVWRFFCVLFLVWVFFFSLSKDLVLFDSYTNINSLDILENCLPITRLWYFSPWPLSLPLRSLLNLFKSRNISCFWSLLFLWKSTAFS